MNPSPAHEVTLTIGNQQLSVWQDVTLRRSLERISAEFQLNLTTRAMSSDLAAMLVKDAPVVIAVDGIEQLDGHLDQLEARFDERGTSYAITGRDKTGDLVDCAATINGPFEFTNQKLETIVAAIIKPYGLSLTVNADTGAAFGRISIQPGETAFEFLDRVCRYRAILPISNGIGGIVLVKPGQAVSPGQLVYGRNILDGSVRHNWSERFSQIVVKGQSEMSDDLDAEQASGGEASARDPAGGRHRPKLIVNDAHGNSQTLQQRAQWEMQFASARSLTASYKVKGFYAAPSRPWAINTLVPVSDPSRGIQQHMLITATQFTKSDAGTFTQIDLSLPQAFDLLPEAEPKHDDGDML